MTRILIVPGLNGSGPEHWQTHWQSFFPRCERVQQRDWDRPELAAWLLALDAHVRASDEPTLLVAHSLGCALVAHWAAAGAVPGHVRGALLVAPADVESEAHTPPELRGFAPLPQGPLGLPALVVASLDDPYCAHGRARELAAAWQARFIDLGACGHINADSQLGGWERGRQLLDELARAQDFVLDERLRADTVAVGESALSLLLLMNDCRYPWLVLVPKRADKAELFELNAGERSSLFEESCLVAESLSKGFSAHKINVGALGNVVRQLHVHHVARSLGDPAWPGPVWGHSPRVPYDQASLAVVRAVLRASPLACPFSVW